jgi:membrane protein DedA with SNARE-associated domain/rhodanese-related sulfurtransferase
METLLAGLSQHGYSILFAAILLETFGLPIPAAPALLITGGASAFGKLNPWLVLAAAMSAMALGDTLMFLLGRRTGWWLLGVLCRISLNPEACIFRSADSFYRRGRILLLFAKFIPGINTMAPPLAGSMNMPIGQFLRLDLAGGSLYVGLYFLIGFVFSGMLEMVIRRAERAGHVVAWILIAGIAVYVVFRFIVWFRSRVALSVSFIHPAEAARAAASGDAVIFDVRSHGYYDRNALRIRGSRRLDPNALHTFETQAAVEKQVYIYCTCRREATSKHVASALQEKGVSCAVIQGGLRAWQKAALPVEPVPSDEVVALPSFAR